MRLAPLTLFVALLCSRAAQAGVVPSPFEQPMSATWPAINRWSDSLEREYSDFARRLGAAVAERRCHQLDQCLRSPEANALYDPATDARLTLTLDCADLPYVLRAYFAFKRKLPFGFVARVDAPGDRDVRYAVGVTPREWKTWRDFRTPRELIEHMVNFVHSGMYRVAPDVESSDFYPLAADRRAIVPGTIFYDPNGHVLVVTDVRGDGVIHLIDGHPDGTLTSKRFGEAFVVGSARLGGGFKGYRPLALRDGRLVRAPNHDLQFFDAHAQYDARSHVIDNVRVNYHAWIRWTLAETHAPVDPVVELREQVRALCADVTDRVEAVDLAIAAGYASRPHPPTLPSNIYGTSGEWEVYSTPSRDARLKAAVRELHRLVASLPDLRERAPALRAAWQEEAARPECQFSYRNSLGQPVPLPLDAVLDRLFALSFDPWSCSERRWGAREGSAEMASCTDGADKRNWYRLEERLRNRIDRDYGGPTPLDSGPASAPAIDVRPLLLGAMSGS